MNLQGVHEINEKHAGYFITMKQTVIERPILELRRPDLRSSFDTGTREYEIGAALKACLNLHGNWGKFKETSQVLGKSHVNRLMSFVH